MENESMCSGVIEGVWNTHVIVNLCIIVALGVISINVIIIIIIITFKSMWKVHNYFAINLALSYVLRAVISVPVVALEPNSNNVFLASTICKLGNYALAALNTTNVLTFTVIAVDRYLVIVSPLSCFLRITKKYSICLIVTTWLVPVIIFFPVLSLRKLQTEIYQNHSCEIKICKEDWDTDINFLKPLFGAIRFAITFAIPVSIVLWTYIRMAKELCSSFPFEDNVDQCSLVVRQRKRAVYIQLTQLAMFICFWLPFNIIELLINCDIMESSVSLGMYYNYTLLLGNCNSAISPTIQLVASHDFKKCAKAIFCKTCFNSDNLAVNGFPRRMHHSRELRWKFYNRNTMEIASNLNENRVQKQEIRIRTSSV